VNEVIDIPVTYVSEDELAKMVAKSVRTTFAVRLAERLTGRLELNAGNIIHNDAMCRLESFARAQAYKTAIEDIDSILKEFL